MHGQGTSKIYSLKSLIFFSTPVTLSYMYTINNDSETEDTELAQVQEFLQMSHHP